MSSDVFYWFTDFCHFGLQLNSFFPCFWFFLCVAEGDAEDFWICSLKAFFTSSCCRCRSTCNTSWDDAHRGRGFGRGEEGLWGAVIPLVCQTNGFITPICYIKAGLNSTCLKKKKLFLTLTWLMIKPLWVYLVLNMSTLHLLTEQCLFPVSEIQPMFNGQCKCNFLLYSA